MEHATFDRMARRLAAGASRRSIVRGALAAAIGSALVAIGHASADAQDVTAENCIPEGKRCGSGGRRRPCTKCCTRNVIRDQNGKRRCSCVRLGNGCSNDSQCCEGVCDAGTCQLSSACDPGLTECVGVCTDLNTDADNCGACGEACAPGQACVAGACACTPASCPAAEHGDVRCIGATCRVECDLGWMNCDGDPATGCETPRGTAQNCAACGDVCDGNTPFCAGRRCVACRDDTNCGDGQVCCDGACLDGTAC